LSGILEDILEELKLHTELLTRIADANDAMAGADPEPEPEPEPEPAPPPPRRGAKPAETKPAATKPAGRGKGKAITEDEVKSKLAQVRDSLGMEKAAEIMEAYGASRFKDLDPKDYPAIAVAADEALAAAPAEEDPLA